MPRAFKLFAAHMRMFIRDTSDTALTLGCTIVAMALCLASMIFQLSWRFPEGCAIQAAYYKIGAPKQCNLPLRIINATHVLRFVVTSSGMIWTWAKLVFKLMRPCSFWEQHGADEVSWAAAWKERGVGGTATPGWTVAASRQVWEEATQAVTSCGLFILCFTVVSSSFIVAAGWAASSDAMYSTGASWEYASRTCDTGNSGNKDKHLNLCLLSWYIRLPMLWASVAFLIALGILVYFIPPRLREAVAVAAAKRTNDMWLLRTGKLHWYLFPAIVLQAFNLYAFMAMEYHVAPAAVVEASGAIGILLLLHTSGLALWILPKQQLWLSLKRKKITPCSSLGVIQSPGRASFWTSIGRALRSLIYIRLEGVYQRKHYLMILIGVAFSGVVVGSGPGYFAAMMGVRATLLGLFLFSRDETDDFASLSRDQYGPGYGLVVDACLLEEALRRHLEGRKPSMERLPTYKATLYRMDNTLAVSYRWQDSEAWVCPGIQLNMSRWQMEKTLETLGEATCLYVWIDRISVPQGSSELQNTLLSRMMGVFATARETLILRTQEEDGSRYHQRAWTMPEYVCAVAPHIHTQEAADSTRIGWSDISAANPEEIVRVHDIRKWYLSELGRFWPLWLLEQPGEEDITVPDVLQAWEKYESICDMLNCRFQEDRIRAIYPLMFRVPVENHEELVKLVDAVARALEARKPDHPGSQIAREHHRLIAEASLKGNHNLEIDELSSVKSVPFQGIESFFSILAGLSTKFSMTE